MSKIIQKYQGDISILLNIELPKDIILKKFINNFVVKEGEISGHRHILETETPQEIQMGFANGGLYIVIGNTKVALTHPQHDTFILGAGTHFLGSQWEYDEREDRKVID